MKHVNVHDTAAYRRRRRARLWRGVRRHGWWIGVLILLASVVLAQWFYPAQYTLPLARYNHEPYGMKHRDELAAREQQRFMKTSVELRLSDATQSVPLTKMGARLDERASFATLTQYPHQWRLVPFSIFFFRPDVTKMPVTFSETPLQEFSSSVSGQYQRPAKDAELRLEGDVVKAADAQAGRSIDDEALRAKIRHTKYDLSGVQRITVPERTVAPAAVAADLAPLRAQAEEMIAKRITITVEGREQTFTPTREEIASWLKIGEKDGAPVLQFNSESFADYIASMDKTVARPAGETRIAIIDGREQERQEGAAGEQINRGDIEQKISSLLFTPGQYKYVAAQLEQIPPQARTTHSYTSSQEGLQAKIRQLGSRYNIRLTIQQLDGAGWQASYRGNESTPSASTYKLYVALRLFEELNAGRTHWNAPMLDTTVAGCFDRMILVSTNQCAEEWIRQFNRGELNNFLYQRGISNVTTFTSSDATRTSADDLVRVVRGIYDGSLASGPNRDKLLEMMSRQMWRKGIPSGTKGWTSDKVGFLWDYVHDVGVVHHPRGTYVMAVMTKGASYGIIAQITRELEALMYP